MLEQTTGDKVLPPMTLLDGRQGWLIGGRFIARIAGGSDDDPPKGDDPPKSDDDEDPSDWDKPRAAEAIRKQREENRRLRDELKAGKATAKELEAAQAKLKEIEDAGRSETEKLAARATEASEKLTAAEARAQDLAIRLSVERAARKLSFIDEDDAFRLLDRKAVEMDDEGTPTNVEALLTALAKAKPHLVAAEAGKNGKASQSVPGTPKPAGGPGQDERLQKDVESLRATGRYSI